jgi:RNA polymerase sigma-70 factor (ECF subfamily)
MCGLKSIKNMADLQNDLKLLTNEQLAAKVQIGCKDSFAELVLRLNNRLLSFLLTRTCKPEDAEDLVQETFAKAYKNIKKFDGRWKFTTWIFKIAVRLANSHYRRQKTVYNIEDIGDFEHKNDGPERIVAKRQQWENIWLLAQKTLSRSQYQSLWLKYAEDMPIKYIAKILGKSKVSVRVTLFRARNNMANVLADKI